MSYVLYIYMSYAANTFQYFFDILSLSATLNKRRETSSSLVAVSGMLYCVRVSAVVSRSRHCRPDFGGRYRI